jgi:hypothetical protein
LSVELGAIELNTDFRGSAEKNLSKKTVRNHFFEETHKRKENFEEHQK